MKKLWILWISLLVIVIGLTTYLVLSNKTEKEPVVQEIYLKVNPLVLFNFTVENDIATVTDFKLENDKAREIFKETDFKGMNLIEAIELYGDKVTEKKIEFTKIYVWTTWDNKEYFKSEKYDLDVTVVDRETIKNIPQQTIPELKYNVKYYYTEEEHGYSITFKENGVLEYHLDETFTEHLCDDHDPDYCYDYTYKDENYADLTDKYQYRFDGDYIFIEGKEGVFYQGWWNAYDKCEVQFNRLKCDNYNSYHDLGPAQYTYTSYYEIR